MSDLPFLAIEHVQLAMPAGQEETARRFYAGVLGMTEVAKPPELAKRGGCWFRSGMVEVHLGVEQDFRPAKKAPPALQCSYYSGLISRLKAAGVEAPRGSRDSWGPALSHSRSVRQPH